jgi:hypothetical protein
MTAAAARQPTRRRGLTALLISIGQPQRSRKTTSMENRMPKVWIERQRGNRSPQPSGGRRRQASPLSLAHLDSATTSRTQRRAERGLHSSRHRRRSSVGQSTALVKRGSRVRIPPSASLARAKSGLLWLASAARAYKTRTYLTPAHLERGSKCGSLRRLGVRHPISASSASGRRPRAAADRLSAVALRLKHDQAVPPRG